MSVLAVNQAPFFDFNIFLLFGLPLLHAALIG